MNVAIPETQTVRQPELKELRRCRQWTQMPSPRWKLSPCLCQS